jgi:hypothetical protein
MGWDRTIGFACWTSRAQLLHIAKDLREERESDTKNDDHGDGTDLLHIAKDLREERESDTKNDDHGVGERNGKGSGTQRKNRTRE